MEDMSKDSTPWLHVRWASQETEQPNKMYESWKTVSQVIEWGSHQFTFPYNEPIFKLHKFTQQPLLNN